MSSRLIILAAVFASIATLCQSCQDEHPELCEAIATANLCDHPGLTLQTKSECRRSCGNCTDSNTVWICYWEDVDGQPANTCSDMSNATLCERFDLDESDCISLSAKGTPAAHCHVLPCTSRTFHTHSHFYSQPSQHGCQGNFRGPTRLKLSRSTGLNSELPVIEYSLHSDASCLFNYAFRDIVQGAAEV
jgi:hypothetical protein